jgi:fibronectin type 3 domain-containing protein
MAITTLTATTAGAHQVNLAWTNDVPYSSHIVYRKDTGAYAYVDTFGGGTTTYSDTTCQDGTSYTYKLTSITPSDPETPIDSNEPSAVTELPQADGLYGEATESSVYLYWNDNSQNETGFKVYQDGDLIATLGANVTSLNVTSLTAGVWYSFYVVTYNGILTALSSNVINILTDDPPAAPTGPSVLSTGTTTAQVNWQDNANNETSFSVERSATSASAGFAEVGTVGADVTTYADSSLSSNTQYWYRVRAHNASGYSAYCAVVTCVTWADIAAPTNLVCVAVSDTIVDIYFDDNSSLEDFHCVERKDSGAYAEIVQLEPNRTAYRNIGLTANTIYTYKVRALQGASTYSSYCAEVAVTTLDVPSAPTGLSVSEYQDTWARLAWTAAATATGYKIQTSTTDAWGGEEVDVGTIPDDITEFKVTGLTAGTLYYFRIRAYNGAGNSAYTASVNQTTRSSYSRSAFERLIQKSSPNLIYLVEVNTGMYLQGWTQTVGAANVYEMPFDERGAEIDAIYENGMALTEKTSIATVDATAGTWWHDVGNGRVYVQASGADSPNNYIYMGSFWLYFTTWSLPANYKATIAPELATQTDVGIMTVFNDHQYLPLVASIPDISQEIQPYFEGNFVITSGSVAFINGEINGTNYFDKKIGRYLWLNRKMKILAGGEGFTYSQFKVVNTGIIDAYDPTDQRISFALRDYRSNIHRTLPIDRYSVDEFALLDDGGADNIRPFGYGVITNAVPVCIDTTNRVFEFHAGRIKSVEKVTQNGTTLTVNTDYFIDYQRGRITLARGLAYVTEDIILVDFTGAVTGADETINTGAGIFKHLMNNYLGVPDVSLNLDSIWATHLAKTTALSLYIWKELDSQELIRRIERSIQADSFQDEEGRLGIKVRLTAAPSDITYIPNAFVMNDFGMSRNQDSIYSGVNVWYGENPSEDKFALVQKTNASATYLHGAVKTLDVYTALVTEATANTLGAAIVALLDKFKVKLTVPRVMFCAQPGDLFYLTRSRYYNSNGIASNKLMRILSISKQQSAGRTQIVAEEV